MKLLTSHPHRWRVTDLTLLTLQNWTWLDSLKTQAVITPPPPHSPQSQMHVIIKAHLDGVRIAGLAKNLKKSRVRHEEETGEDETLLLQVSSEGLLADLQLLQQVRQELGQGVITHAALHHVGIFMCTLHDLLPRLVNVGETLGFLKGSISLLTT